jgi:mannose-1-phosphate guanylyltransferase
MSRHNRPKQFLPLGPSGTSLLEATAARLAPLVEPEQTWVVTNRRHVDLVHASLPRVPSAQVLAEPVGRDTAACVAWACAEMCAVDRDAVCVVLPADHVIPDDAALRQALDAGARHVGEHHGLLTFGIRPTRPETGFGYLRLGAEVTRSATGLSVHQLDAFVEKPDREQAQAYLASGAYLWNSGMFAWRAEDLLAEVDRQLPRLGEGVRALATTAGADRGAAVERLYPSLPRTSVDYGIMEGARQRWTVPVAFEWSDVGSWPALREVLPVDASGTVRKGDVVDLGCTSAVLVSDGVTVTAVGVQDTVVVASGNAVLVAPMSEAQRIKELVGRLQELGRDDLL